MKEENENERKSLLFLIKKTHLFKKYILKYNEMN